MHTLIVAAGIARTHPHPQVQGCAPPSRPGRCLEPELAVATTRAIPLNQQWPQVRGLSAGWGRGVSTQAHTGGKQWQASDGAGWNIAWLA